MSTIPQATSVTVASATADWTDTFMVRSSVLDSINPNFPRTVRLSPVGLIVSKSGSSFGFPLEQLMIAAVSVVPQLTWPPVISVQPADMTVPDPDAAQFSVTASSESSISTTYQWQISSDSGSTWSDLTDSGPYGGSTTNTLGISDSTGLNGKQYRCTTSNVSGSTISSAATLTVT